MPTRIIGRHKALSSGWGQPPGPVAEDLKFLHTSLDNTCQRFYFLMVLPGRTQDRKASLGTHSTTQRDKDSYQGNHRDFWWVDKEPGYCNILGPPSPCSCSFCFFFSSLRSFTLRSLALPMPPAWRMDSSRVARPLEGSTTSLGAP